MLYPLKLSPVWGKFTFLTLPAKSSIVKMNSDHLPVYPAVEPTEEMCRITLEEYRSREKDLPVVPPKTPWPFWVIGALSFLFFGILLLLLYFIRLPFILLRRLRILWLKKQAMAVHRKNTARDDDWAGREFVFVPPAYLPNKGQRRLAEARKQAETDMNRYKELYAHEQENLPALFHYSTYAVLTGKPQLGLYLLDGLKELYPPVDLDRFRSDAVFNEANIYRNMAAVCAHLGLRKHAHLYDSKIPGGIGKVTFGTRLLRALGIGTKLFGEFWGYFVRDITQVWPRRNV